MRVVFMGTPEIAAVCLKRILEDGINVVGVFTQPDRPKNRGMKLVHPPVKELAMQYGLPVCQPESFRDPRALEQLAAWKPDVAAVVAYGKLLPQQVLELPPKGCVNIHASLLPEYRGAAPYQWAVLDGRTETGVTAMYLSREMDAGDIIESVATPIGPDETAGELLDRLAVLGAELLRKTLRRMELGAVAGVPQDGTKATYAPMLDKRMCPVDWTRTARQVHDQVRGLHPWPVATARFGGKLFKLHSTVLAEGSGEPGEVLGLTKTGLVVACGSGAIEIRELQAEGGKRMSAPDYFRGHPQDLPK